MKFQIKGDGSYLGVVDVGAYKGFVGSDWADNPRLLEPHFIGQMQEYTGLFWDTNLESDYLVEVQTNKSSVAGFREITGSLKVTGEKVVILEYDALSGMAQFEGETLEEHIKDNCLTLENGNYLVRIVQMFDPKSHFPDGNSTDFVIDIVRADSLLPPWQEVPWSILH